MILILFVIIINFIIGSLLGYFIHKVLHTEINNRVLSRLTKSHCIHHTLYSIYDFESEHYRSAGKDASIYVFVPIISVVILVLAYVFWLMFQMWWTFPVIILEGIIIGVANNYIHDAFHIKQHWLNKFSWFKKLKLKHWLHHLDENTNYGIIWFLPDKIFRTYFK